MNQIGNSKIGDVMHSPMDSEESTSACGMNASGEMLLRSNVMGDSSDSRPFQNLQQRNISATSNDVKYRGDTAIAEARDFQALKKCGYLKIISTAITAKNWQALEDILSKVIRIDMTDKESIKINSNIVRMIQGPGIINDVFTFAVKNNQLSLIKVLIKTGYNVNRGGDILQYFRPLTYAVSVKNSPVVDLLLQNGADTTIADKEYWNRIPLLLAVSNGDAECTKLLLEHGANPHAVNHSQPPLYFAVTSSSVECAELLVSHKAEIKDCDEDLNYIRLAVNENHTGMVQFLLKHKANPNLKRSHGSDDRLTLRQAIYKKNLDIVRLLLAHKVAIGDGDSHKAAMFNDIACMNLLLNHGSDVNAVTHDKSLLNYAVSHSLAPMAKYLRFKGAKFSSADDDQLANERAYNDLLKRKGFGAPAPSTLAYLSFWKTNDYLDTLSLADRRNFFDSSNIPNVLEEQLRAGFFYETEKAFLSDNPD